MLMNNCCLEMSPLRYFALGNNWFFRCLYFIFFLLIVFILIVTSLNWNCIVTEKNTLFWINNFYITVLSDLAFWNGIYIPRAVMNFSWFIKTNVILFVLWLLHYMQHKKKKNLISQCNKEQWICSWVYHWTRWGIYFLLITFCNTIEKCVSS